MYALLARGLAERGIASLRYDKRGLPTSAGPFDMATTTLADYAADVAAAACLLDARDDVGPVVLLGHSEGGTLAMLAARDGAPAAGLVLVATAGRDATTILREQLSRELPPALLAQFDTAWAAYLHNDSSVVPPPALAPLFVPAHRRFLQSWQEIRPVELLEGLGKPALVLQGENDLQVRPADARALGSAHDDVRLVLLPDVNHTLKLASGETVAAQMAAYTDPSLPLAPSVVPTIAEWILAKVRPAKP
jgi:pimeloyl-ACP methyl ester carboxylesterase